MVQEENGAPDGRVQTPVSGEELVVTTLWAQGRGRGACKREDGDQG